jgi:hypothetical protein
LAESGIVDQAPIGIPGTPRPRYVKPKRVPVVFRAKPQRLTLVAQDRTIVTFRKRRVPLRKIVVPAEANYLAIRPTLGVSLVVRSSISVHTRQTFRSEPAVVQAQLDGQTSLLTHQHSALACVARGNAVLVNQAASAFHVHQTLDITATAETEAVALSTVDFQTHQTLDVASCLQLEAQSIVSAVFIKRVPNVLSVREVATATFRASASCDCIEDRLTDEELLFLLEAA